MDLTTKTQLKTYIEDLVGKLSSSKNEFEKMEHVYNYFHLCEEYGAPVGGLFILLSNLNIIQGLNLKKTVLILSKKYKDNLFIEKLRENLLNDFNKELKNERIETK